MYIDRLVVIDLREWPLHYVKSFFKARLDESPRWYSGKQPIQLTMTKRQNKLWWLMHDKHCRGELK